MTVEDSIKLAVAVAAAAGAFGLGNQQGGSSASIAAEGWCGAALATQAQFYQEQLDECAGPN